MLYMVCHANNTYNIQYELYEAKLIFFRESDYRINPEGERRWEREMRPVR